MQVWFFPHAHGQDTNHAIYAPGPAHLFYDLLSCHVGVHATDKKHLLRPFPVFVGLSPFTPLKIDADLVFVPTATQDVVFGVLCGVAVLLFNARLLPTLHLVGSHIKLDSHCC
jgi:hypothetical protein